jgi:OOP family OmpA-OmpF porin
MQTIEDKDMKLKASRLVGFMAFTAVISSTALAESSGWGDYSGWYIGANIGKSNADIDNGRISRNLLGAGLSTTSIRSDDDDTGYKVFGGYQFNRYLALEGGYFDLGEFGFNANTNPLGTLNSSIKVRGINFDVVGFIPFTEKLSLFGRAGVNYAETKDSFRGTGAVLGLNSRASDRELNPKLGVGLQYDYNDSWAWRVEAERYRINDGIGNKGDVDLVSVGVVYRFGTTPTPAPVVVVAPTPTPTPRPTPAPTPPPRKFVKYSLSANELFAFNSSEVRLPQPKLDEIATALKGEGAPEHIVIKGYSDRLGADSYNQKLSERRALAVKDYMVTKGIPSERLIAEGHGESDPVVTCTETNTSELIKCLAPNRRVEIDEVTIVKEVKK